MQVAIIGGGVTGLAAAHRLQEVGGKDVSVRLIEGSDRLGGVIATDRRDGFVLEQGPDSMITDKPWGLALARRLGLEAELIGTNETNRRSFVVRGGELMPVPEGFQLLAPSRFGPLVGSRIFSWPGKARMAFDLFLPRREDNSDESLGSFVTRRLGREALDRMAQPMIAGIYGADPMNLSLRATLPRFLDMEREHGSVIRAMWARMRAANGKPGGGPPGNPPNGTAANGQGSANRGVSGARYGLFVSFRNGMQTLTDALEERLPAGSVLLNTVVERLERRGDRWQLRLDSGETVDADAVILSLPAHRSARLLEPLDSRSAEILAEIPYASSATMSLCYRREDVPHPLDGFGFVVPSIEKLTLLGCTFTNVKYSHRAPEGVALLRAFLGETALQNRDDNELEQLVRADLRKLLGITAAPQFVVTGRHPRSMAQYAVGHLDRIAEVEERITRFPGLALAGNAYHGIGIPDCVHSAEQAAEAVLATH
jgi:oxygen-dependent protoporphyrinogen oxidase